MAMVEYGRLLCSWCTGSVLIYCHDDFSAAMEILIVLFSSYILVNL